MGPIRAAILQVEHDHVRNELVFFEQARGFPDITAFVVNELAALPKHENIRRWHGRASILSWVLLAGAIASRDRGTRPEGCDELHVGDGGNNRIPDSRGNAGAGAPCTFGLRARVCLDASVWRALFL